jgi:site-specific recombinase XerD
MREGVAMTDTALMAPWVRRFLLEHVVGERNLSLNTQKSYRDMLLQLLPFIAAQGRRPLERSTRSRDLSVSMLPSTCNGAPRFD